MSIEGDSAINWPLTPNIQFSHVVSRPQSNKSIWMRELSESSVQATVRFVVVT
jgi:hypothetical protein